MNQSAGPCPGWESTSSPAPRLLPLLKLHITLQGKSGKLHFPHTLRKRAAAWGGGGYILSDPPPLTTQPEQCDCRKRGQAGDRRCSGLSSIETMQRTCCPARWTHRTPPPGRGSPAPGSPAKSRCPPHPAWHLSPASVSPSVRQRGGGSALLPLQPVGRINPMKKVEADVSDYFSPHTRFWA